MKKVLSFVLVLAMLLGCFSMVFAASFTDVEDGDDHEDAINVLSSLGVVSGYTDNTFKPEKVVTRAEMAAFIINALFGQDKKITQRATKFSDVTASHWASGFVDYANTLDIIAGYTDGTFKPDQTVTYNEAITMIVKALGYRDAALNGTYPASYVSKAQALGLLKDVDGLGTAGAVRGDIAQLVYNALPCAIGSMNKDGEWVEATPFDCMYKRLGVYDVEDAVLIYGDEDSEIDLDEYLGQYVKIAVNAEGDIVAITSVESTAYTAKTNDATPVTKIGDYKLSKIEEKTAAFFVNGEFTTEAAFKAADLAPKATYTFNGNFSGNYVTKIYSIMKWTPDKTFMVTDDMLEELDEDDTLNGYDFAKNNKDEIDEDSFTIVGVDSLADLEEDYVVTVYLNEDKEVTRLEVGTETVEAKMTKRVGTKVTFDGTKYDYAKAADLKFEQDYVLYFDYAGELYAIEEAEEAEATEFYAVLVDAYDGKTTENWASQTAAKDLQIKVLDTTGETNVYVVDKDIKTTVKFDKTDLNKVVVYTLDEDGVVDTLKLELALGTTSKKVNSKGVIDTYYFADDAVVFQCTDETEYEWKVVKAADLAKAELGKAAYTINTKGMVDLLVFASSETTDKTFGFYIDAAEVSKTEKEVYFWVDGEEVTYTTKSFDAAKATAAYELAEITAKTSEVTMKKVEATKTATVGTTGAAIKGNTLVIDGNEKTSYALDKNVIVYVYDESDKELSVSTVAKLADVAEKYMVYLYDTDDVKDNTFEIVVFTQK